MSLNNKDRENYIDVARGICLLLVVYAHAKGPRAGYIYLFHMPFFFFLSGYLHNTKTDWKSFLLKKIRNYYIPFVFWNVAVTTLRFVFGHMGFKSLLRQIIYVFLAVEKDGKIMGATWFLGSLFLVSVFYKLIETAMSIVKQRYLVILIMSVIAAAGAFYYKLPHMQSRTVILSAYYALAVWLHSIGIDLKKYSRFWPMILSFILYVIIGNGVHVNMGTNVYRTMPKFILTSLLGIYFILSLSVFLSEFHSVPSKGIKRMLSFVGRRGIDLVLWQFAAFWIVTTLQQYLRNGTFIEFMKGDAVQRTSHGWWAVYFVFGLTIPLLWGNILREGKWGKIFKKLHIV